MERLSLVKNFLLDLIFPRYCLGCKKELSAKQISHLCEICFDSVAVNPAVQCFVCRKRVADGRTCPKCLKKTKIGSFFAAGRYEDPLLKEMIHYLKYNFLQTLAAPLGRIAVKFIKQNQLEYIFENAILVPVPLTRSRRAQRGFNQSELIALEILKYLQPKADLPLAGNGAILRNDLMQRIKFNQPQADIPDFQKRKNNVENAFLAKKPVEIKKLVEQKFKFILIDDVSTSGATLEECAKTLKSAGAKEIWALVIARG